MSFPLQPKQHVQWHSFEECMEHLNDIMKNPSSKQHENVYFSTVCPSQLPLFFKQLCTMDLQAFQNKKLWMAPATKEAVTQLFPTWEKHHSFKETVTQLFTTWEKHHSCLETFSDIYLSLQYVEHNRWLTMNEQQERNKSQQKTYMHASAGGTHVPYHGTQKKDNIITVTNYKIDIFRTIISLFEKYLEKFLKKNNVRIEEELSSISSNLLHQCRNKTVQTEELHQHMERLVMLDAFRKHPNLSRKKDGVFSPFFNALPNEYKTVFSFFGSTHDNTMPTITSEKDIPIGVRLCFLNYRLKIKHASCHPMYALCRILQERSLLAFTDDVFYYKFDPATVRILVTWAKRIHTNLHYITHIKDNSQVQCSTIGDFALLNMQERDINRFIVDKKHLWAEDMFRFFYSESTLGKWPYVRDSRAPFAFATINARISTKHRPRYDDDDGDISHQVLTMMHEAPFVHTIQRFFDDNIVHSTPPDSKARTFYKGLLDEGYALPQYNFFFMDSHALKNIWPRWKHQKKLSTPTPSLSQIQHEFFEKTLLPQSLFLERHNKIKNFANTTLAEIPDVWDRFLEVKRTCTEDHIGEEYLKRFLNIVGGKDFLYPMLPAKMSSCSYLGNNAMPEHFLMEPLSTGQRVFEYMIENDAYPLSFPSYTCPLPKEHGGTLMNILLKKMESEKNCEEDSGQRTLIPCVLFIQEPDFWRTLLHFDIQRIEDIAYVMGQIFMDNNATPFMGLNTLEKTLDKQSLLLGNMYKAMRTVLESVQPFSAHAMEILEGYTWFYAVASMEEIETQIQDSLQSCKKTPLISHEYGKYCQEKERFMSLCGTITATHHKENHVENLSFDIL